MVFCSKVFTHSGCRLQILAIFQEFLSEGKKESLRPKSFMSTQKLKKKKVPAREFWAVSTNLGVLCLDLHSSSPEPVNFVGAQSSLGGCNFCLRGHKQPIGGTAPECPQGRQA